MAGSLFARFGERTLALDLRFFCLNTKTKTTVLAEQLHAFDLSQVQEKLQELFVFLAGGPSSFPCILYSGLALCRLVSEELLVFWRILFCPLLYASARIRTWLVLLRPSLQP